MQILFVSVQAAALMRCLPTRSPAPHLGWPNFGGAAQVWGVAGQPERWLWPAHPMCCSVCKLRKTWLERSLPLLTLAADSLRRRGLPWQRESCRPAATLHARLAACWQARAGSAPDATCPAGPAGSRARISSTLAPSPRRTQTQHLQATHSLACAAGRRIGAPGGAPRRPARG